MIQLRLISLGVSALSDAELVELVTGVQYPHTQLQKDKLEAARELGRRGVLRKMPVQKRLDQPAALLERLRPVLAHLPHEEFWAVLLNSRCEEVASTRISSGGLTHCSVLPRECFEPVITHRAPMCAFAHNHPSGDPRPSPDDLRLQLQLDEGAKTLGITVVDHLIVAQSGGYSVRAGLL